jgi:hypothetical protein
MSRDQRREVRIGSRGEVSLLAEGVEGLSCSVYDISVSGLGLELEAQSGKSIKPGTAVEIRGQGFSGVGVVRHCRQIGTILRIGVQLTEV